ncbi:MAG TPA: hypothetical protein VG034_04085 [Acidimicrobiia bacterium]|jgi:hypothetical protein|nr:hypothetical protein [Acidimicrobiia bacterium]
MGRSRTTTVAVTFGAIALLGASVAVASITTGTPAKASPGVDLGIADTSGLARPGLQAFADPAQRPGILIAWRNSAKVRETEVRVRNLGATAGNGQMWVDIIDGDHRVLESAPAAESPFVVSLPKARDGGDTGMVVQIPGSYHKNQLLDELDRSHDPYCIRVRLDTLDQTDVNPLDNVAVKCYNTSAKMAPGGVALHPYTFRNDTGKTVQGRIAFQRSHLPRGWSMEARPKPGKAVTLRPGEVLRGSVVIRGPQQIVDGSYADVRPMLVTTSGAVFDKSEFFVAVDDRAPEFTEAFAAPGTNGFTGPGSLGESAPTAAAARNTIYVNLRAIDSLSGVAEASGASVIFSTDDGFTRTVRTMTYSDGNFTAPTGFDTDIGPFPAGTVVELAVAVRDVVGNETRTKPVKLTVPLAEQIDLH